MIVTGHHVGSADDSRLRLSTVGGKKDFTAVNVDGYPAGAEFGSEEVANMLILDGCLTPGDVLLHRDGTEYTVVAGPYKRLRLVDKHGKTWGHRKIYA